MYLRVSNFVVWIICLLRTAGRWVPRNGSCVQNAIDGGGDLDTTFIIYDGDELNTDNEKRFCAAR